MVVESDDLSPQQRVVLETVVDAVCASHPQPPPPPRHVLIEAVAGAGKTRTLVAMVQALRARMPEARCLLLAFNAEMARHLRLRLRDDPGAEVATLHAFGLRLCSRAAAAAAAATTDGGGEEEGCCPSQKRRRVDPDLLVEVDPDKAHRIWASLVDVSTHTVAEWLRIRAAVDRFRQSGQRMETEVVETGPRSLVDTILARMLVDRQVVDQEDQIWMPLHYGWCVPPEEHYDLVLIDEAQDLNPAQHAFLRQCVAPPGSRTHVCAVGDPHQAIYAFRGADPQSMDRLADLFGMELYRLTCCFRCPRRVVFVAGQINRCLHAAPTAGTGVVRIATVSDPLRDSLPDTVYRLVRENPPTTLFVSRGNPVLLDLLRGAYRQPPVDLSLRWISPSIERSLDAMLRSAEAARLTLAAYVAHINATVALSQPDRTILRILDLAVELDGPNCIVTASGWMRFLTDVLRSSPEEQEDKDKDVVVPSHHDPLPLDDDEFFDPTWLMAGEEDGDDDPPPSSPPPALPRLVLATVHAVKGMEFPHVVCFEYNLFGVQNRESEHSQEHNLLYIALTRSTERLTLLLTRRNQRVISPYLPIEMIYYANEMWNDAVAVT